MILNGFLLVTMKVLNGYENTMKKEIKDMLEKMQEIISEGLGVDPSQVVETASFKDDLEADSLDLFEMVMAMEEEFGVSIPAEELEKMVTVGDVMKYIEANQN